MSERMLRADEPMLVFDVAACLLLILEVPGPFVVTLGGTPTEGGT